MSYILEALKKSEAERRQGKVPEFGQQQYFLLRKNRSPAYLPVIAVALVSINLLALVFWFFWQTGIWGKQDSDPIQSSTPVVSAPVATKVPAATSPAVTTTAIRPVTQPDHSVANKEVELQEAVIEPAKQEEAFEKPDELTGSRSSAKSEAQSQTQARAETIPHLDSLPASFKRRVPDLIFNSHIYSDDASASRVMINNIYLRTGEYLADLKLEAITEQGVVLSLDGRKFRLGVLSDWSNDS
ncbi:MAG: hypothetical protein CSA50_07180 [Gammaproteobacteria bacterium]|nr:MAG: hypothetical protein CSA50_07180 [Gammaproteobacteria bacterium]